MQKYLKRECFAFLAHVVEKDQKLNHIQGIPVVRNYPKVFLEDLPGPPPLRQVEFQIDLVPGAAPVAKALYRLAPSKIHVVNTKGIHVDPAKIEAIKNWEASRKPTKIYQFMGLVEGDFIDLHLNDIEDMLLLAVQHKLFHLIDSDIVDFIVALQSYQKKLNITPPQQTFPEIEFKELYPQSHKPPRVIYEDLTKQKRVMWADELYKFSDGTLKKVWDELQHRIRDFRLEYNKEMPRRKWTAIDRKRNRVNTYAIRNTKLFSGIEDSHHGPSDAMHNPSQPLKSDTKVLTMTMEILLEPTSNKLCVADSLSIKERLRPLRVRALGVLVQTSLISLIQETQRVAVKEENLEEEALSGANQKLETGADGIKYLNGRAWIPKVNNLRKIVMDEAHRSRYLIHLGADKMYMDVKDYYWWPGIKKDIALYVRKCLTCAKVKAEHHNPYGLL
ncbi:putative reverse transcriptase domain-containing protein [Tanacetum coccineum]